MIVGAGYAGLPCALELARQKNAKRTRITLVNREPRQELVCDLYRALRNGRPELFPFLKTLRKHGIHFVEGSAHGFEPEAKLLHVRGDRAQSIAYDELVVATGSKAKLPQIDGLQELLDGPSPLDRRVFLFRNNTQVQALRLALRRIDWSPESRPGGRDLFCVIVGAGTTGLEVAGELATFRGRNPACRIVLVDGKPDILPDFPMLARNIYKRDLRRARVETVLGSPATKLTEKELHIENGQVIPWDLLILCSGGRSTSTLRAFGPAASDEGLAASANLGIAGWPHHHVIGDLARPDGVGLPLTAQLAGQSGRFVARKIAAALSTGRTPRDAFEANDLGSLVSFGPYAGVGRLGGAPESPLGRLVSPFVFGPPVDELKRAAKIRYLWGLR